MKKLMCKIFGCVCNSGNIADFICPRCGMHHKVKWPPPPKDEDIGVMMNNKGLVFGELMIVIAVLSVVILLGGMGG